MSHGRIDQASELRALIHQSRHADRDPAPQASKVRGSTLAITSGKGGVGKSLIALNLSIALAQAGEKVCLLDADLGLGNLDLLCGLNGYWNVSHVLTRSRSLREVMLQGPEGISIIPGASGLAELADLPPSGRETLLEELARLDREYDYLIVDCGSGIHRGVRQFAASADTVLLVSTLEATSLADTYAALKIYHSAGIPDVRLVFNQADTQQAQRAILNIRKTARQFLQTDVAVMGCIPSDPLLAASVSRRTPFLTHFADSSTGQAIRHLARLLNEQRVELSPRNNFPFIQRLQADSLSAA